jgi:hypothetical protein
MPGYTCADQYTTWNEFYISSRWVRNVLDQEFLFVQKGFYGPYLSKASNLHFHLVERNFGYLVAATCANMCLCTYVILNSFTEYNFVFERYFSGI